MIDVPVEHFAEVFFEVTKKPSNPKIITTLSNFWHDLSRVLSVPRSEKEYQRTLNLFEKLIDIVGDNKIHPLSSLMETLCLLIESYETKHYPKPEVSGNEILQFLMEQNALNPSDLPEIGTIDKRYCRVGRAERNPPTLQKWWVSLRSTHPTRKRICA